MREELLEKVNGGTVHTEVTGTDYKVYLVHPDKPSMSREPGGADPMIFEDEFIIG